MDPLERTYRTLLVSSVQKTAEVLQPVFSGCRCTPVMTAADAASARRLLLENSYDIAVINASLTDEFGTRLALDIAGESSAGVLLLVKAEHFEAIEARVSPFGVLVLSKPTSSAAVSRSLTLLCATRERLRRMERKTATLEDKMEEIRLVNQAKWLLIGQLKMTEQDAHRYIQKTAMNRGLTRRAVAEEIIRMYG